MSERIIDTLVTDYAIHQLVHVCEDGKFRRESRCYPVRPDEVAVIELTAEEESERVKAFAVCRKVGVGQGRVG